MTRQRVWLITGASSGFGRAVTEVVLAKGDIAVATARSPSSLDDLVKETPADQLLVLKCDVTIREDISSAFKSTYERFGRCDVVFNNAGSGYLAKVEAEQDEEARWLLEVNFWASANVTTEAIRAFRDLNPPGEGGFLLTNSSMAGMIRMPASGYYCTSKHTLEGLTKTLAKAISPEWNIKISIIEPSAYKTRAHDGNMLILDAPLAYMDPSMPSQQVRQWYAAESGPYGDPKKAAERIFKFSKNRRHFAGLWGNRQYQLSRRNSR